MKCERCGKELSDSDLYCSRCGKAVFPEYMDEEDIWAYYKSDEELEQILKAEEGQKEESQPEVSETEIPLSEKVPLENSQPEILEAEDRESDAVLPEMAVEDPENQEYPEEVSGEEEPASEEAPSPVLEVVKENAEPKDGEAARESEDLDDDER